MKVFFLAIIVSIAGCRGSDDDGKKIHHGLQIVVANGCQYVLYIDRNRGSSSIVHAGNCNNPTHQK